MYCSLFIPHTSFQCSRRAKVCWKKKSFPVYRCVDWVIWKRFNSSIAAMVLWLVLKGQRWLWPKIRANKQSCIFFLWNAKYYSKMSTDNLQMFTRLNICLKRFTNLQYITGFIHISPPPPLGKLFVCPLSKGTGLIQLIEIWNLKRRGDWSPKPIVPWLRKCLLIPTIASVMVM